MNLSAYDNPIGLDIGGWSIKAAQRDGHGGWRTIALPRRSRDAQDLSEELGRVTRVMRRNGFTGNRVVAACPHDKLITEPLRLPPLGSGAPLEELARAELMRVRQLNSDDFELAYWPIPTPARGGDGLHVMATACRHADAGHVLDALDRAGFDVVVLDTAGCAAARGCAPAEARADGGIVGMLDVGWDAARLTLVHEGVIVFERANEDAAMRLLLETLGRGLSIDEALAHHLCAARGITPLDEQATDDPAWRSVLLEAQALIVAHFDRAAQELSMSMSYAGHRYPDHPVARLVLVGGGAALPGLSEHLAAALGVEVAPARPTGVGDDALVHPPAVVHALGLASAAAGVAHGRAKGVAA